MLQTHFVLKMLLCATATVSLSINASNFNDKVDQGFYWYEVQTELDSEPVVEPEVEAIPPPIVVEKKTTPVPVKEVTTPAPPIFSVSWFQANLEKYLEKAIDKPTDENINTYMLLNRISIDKADRFQEKAYMEVIGNPALDANARRSMSTSFGFSIDNQADTQLQLINHKLRKTKGLFFFFSSDCRTCDLGAEAIQKFRRVYPYDVVPISVNGKPLDNGIFPDYKVDDGQANLLSVTTLPAIFLIDPKNANKRAGIAPIAQGAISVSTLKSRIITAALKKKWISQDEYNLTKPARSDLNFASAFESQGIDGKAAMQNIVDLYGDETGFIEPELLQSMLQTEISNSIKYNSTGTGNR